MMDILFECLIKTKRHGILKNFKQILTSKKTGRPFIAKSHEAMEQEKWMLMKLNIEKIKQRIDMITCDVNAKFIFYFPATIFFTKKGVRSQKLGDLDNLCALPLDCLQKSGILESDNLVCSLDGCRRLPMTESNEYYLKIELSKIESQV